MHLKTLRCWKAGNRVKAARSAVGAKRAVLGSFAIRRESRYDRPRKLLSRVDYDCMTMKLLAARWTNRRARARVEADSGRLHDSEFLNNNRN